MMYPNATTEHKGKIILQFAGGYLATDGMKNPATNHGDTSEKAIQTVISALVQIIHDILAFDIDEHMVMNL